MQHLHDVLSTSCYSLYAPQTNKTAAATIEFSAIPILKSYGLIPPTVHPSSYDF